jgi:hypothetical protein
VQPTIARPLAGLVWWPAFLLTQIAAFVVVLALDPAGFDACDLTAGSGPREIQATVAAVAVGAPVGVAVWRLRRGLLVAALSSAALAAAGWVWLLVDRSQSC